MQWLKPKNQIFYVAGTMWWFIRLLLILSVHNLFDFESYFHFPFTHLFVWSFPHILSSVFVPKARNLQWMCIYRRVSPRLCVRSEAFWEWMKFVIDSVDRLGFEWGKEATCIACRVFIFYVLLFSLDGNWFWPLSIRLNFYD